MGAKPQIPVVINLPSLSNINHRKVLISHIIIVVSVIAIIFYPDFPDSAKTILETFRAVLTKLVRIS